MLILLRFFFIRKNEKPNDINEHGVKSDRLLAARGRRRHRSLIGDIDMIGKNSRPI